MSELFQNATLRGPLTWQVALMNRWLGASSVGLLSGGNASSDGPLLEDVLFEESIDVDENRWFTFLQKDRWYDLIQDPDNPQVMGGPWSVDNPTIWEPLRVCVELVDRILKALISDGHSAQVFNLLPPRIEVWSRY